MGTGVVFGVGGCRTLLPEDEDVEDVNVDEFNPGGDVVGRSKKGCNPTRTRGSPIGIGRSARLLKGLCGTLSSSSCLSSTKSL